MLKEVKKKFLLYQFGFKIPLILFVNPKIIQMDHEKCVIKIPLNFRTKNHLNSMYFGVLATGADLAGALVAIDLIAQSNQQVSLSFKDFKADFYKRAHGDVHFVCTQVAAIEKFVEEVIATSERKNFTVEVEAFVPSIDPSPVAKFSLTLSLKKK